MAGFIPPYEAHPMRKPPKKFEGSPEDRREDKKNAKKLGMPLKTYEQSAADKKKDAAGQRKLNAKRGKK